MAERAPDIGDPALVRPDRWPHRARRLVWGLVAVDALMLVGSIALLVFYPQFGSQYGGRANQVLAVALALQVGIGALIALRLPRHPVGWLLLGAATASLFDQGVVQNYVIYAIDVRHRAIPGGDLVGTIDQMNWVFLIAPVAIFLPLVFPTGRLLSRRWRVFVWIALAVCTATFVGNSFSTSQNSANLTPGVRPVALPVPWSMVADVLSGAILLLPVCVLVGVVSLVLRYRRGSSDERHQIKWLLFAISVYLVGFGASLVPTLLGYSVPLLQGVAVVGLALIPIATGIAILRYRLYDVDVAISRTLVYGSLAVFITAVYVGFAVGIGTLVDSGGKPNLGLSILATAIVAVGFQPVRERLQKVANRLVYGKRATPYEVLSQFSERVAESYATDDVMPRMARILAEGTGAQRADVWLRSGGAWRQAAVWPVDAVPMKPRQLDAEELPAVESDRVVMVRHQGDLLGALSVTKRSGESLTPVEENLLTHLADQAGLVLKNVGLTADLQARLDELRMSRQRLVTAQDEERRRLERNLHDGAQQNLVALKVKLGLAEMLMARDPNRARATINQLKSDADDALETLRDLARGIYPPLLADKGLGAALESQARKATVSVTVDADGIGRYAQDVEAAVYFAVLEALQNVQKYAEASAVVIRLREKEGELCFHVDDNGRGFDIDTTAKGSGLTNIADRLDALRGGLKVISSLGKGTSLQGRIAADREQPVAAVG